MLENQAPQPPGEGGRTSQAVQASIRLQKRFLSGIFGGGSVIPQKAERVPDRHVLEPTYKQVKGEWVSRLRPLYQWQKTLI
jgi:hypothetical protein